MAPVEIKFKRIDDRAILPQYQTAGASGFDLHTIEDVDIRPGETKLIRTGLACELPKIMADHCLCELQIRPRGGMSYKTPLRIANTPGTVDSDYRGEIIIIANNIDDNRIFHIKAGQRIAQGVVSFVIQPLIVEIDDLPDTERGDGRLGSTGE